jgi:hypothetical protein
MKFKMKCEGVVLKTDNCKLARAVLQFLADEQLADQKRRNDFKPQTWTATYSAKPDLSKIKTVKGEEAFKLFSGKVIEEAKVIAEKEVKPKRKSATKRSGKPAVKKVPTVIRPHKKKREETPPRKKGDTAPETNTLWSAEENEELLKAIYVKKLPISKITNLPEFSRHSEWGIVARIYSFKRKDGKVGSMAMKQIKDFVKKYGIS